MDKILARLSQTNIERAAREAGVTLTKEQALEIAELEHGWLAECGRISFGEGASTRVIHAFASSPYIAGESAGQTLAELTGAFYELREDFPASTTDVEIIEALVAVFDGEAAGDTGLAAARTRESLASQQDYSTYEIADENGGNYRWDSDEWHDDIMADGWYGERWENCCE